MKNLEINAAPRFCLGPLWTSKPENHAQFQRETQTIIVIFSIFYKSFNYHVHYNCRFLNDIYKQINKQSYALCLHVVRNIQGKFSTIWNRLATSWYVIHRTALHTHVYTPTHLIIQNMEWKWSRQITSIPELRIPVGSVVPVLFLQWF